MITPFKGRQIDPLTKVFAYRNLHSGKWSLRAETGQHKGQVIGHADKVSLIACDLKVSEAGRQRVLRERKKNVHAGVVGTIVHEFDPSNHDWQCHNGTKLSYNPYKAPTFEVDGKPASYATMVHLGDDGKAYAFGVVR